MAIFLEFRASLSTYSTTRQPVEQNRIAGSSNNSGQAAPPFLLAHTGPAALCALSAAPKGAIDHYQVVFTAGAQVIGFNGL